MMELSSSFREILIQLRHDLKDETGNLAATLATLDMLIWQLQQQEEARLERLTHK